MNFNLTRNFNYKIAISHNVVKLAKMKMNRIPYLRIPRSIFKNTLDVYDIKFKNNRVNIINCL